MWGKMETAWSFILYSNFSKKIVLINFFSLTCEYTQLWPVENICSLYTIFQVCLSLSTQSAAPTLPRTDNSKLAQWQLNYPMALELVTWNDSCENISIPFLPFKTDSINLCHFILCLSSKILHFLVLEALISVQEFSTGVQFTNRKTDISLIHSLLNFKGNFWPWKRIYSAVSAVFSHILITTVIFLQLKIQSQGVAVVPGPLLPLTFSTSNSIAVSFIFTTSTNLPSRYLSNRFVTSWLKCITCSSVKSLKIEEAQWKN